MRGVLVAFWLNAVVAGPAFGQGAAEKSAMLAVRLTTEAGVLGGCERVGSISDDSLEDLRKKIVRSGGNAGLLTFDSDDLDRVHAEVFRCGLAQK
jgi:hypothetical protein